MELKDIVAVSGQGGLHKIIGRTKNGLILETIGSTKKFATGYQDRVSILEDISMYSIERDVKLSEIFFKANAFGNVPTAKDDASIQRKYLVELINLDSERVYDSDIKKFFNWYNALIGLVDFATLNSEVKSDIEDNDGIENEVETKDEKPKKIAAKKTATPKTTAPKNTTPKTNSKGAGASKTTYRPKSV